MEWEPVIGLEIHAQLSTKSKIFSGASTEFGAAPNTQACAVDLGLPGVLPVLNGSAIAMAVKFGLATHSTVARRSVFARKNYFYPDLPKGYQISQYELPVVHDGYVDIEAEGAQSKRIGVTRAHLEEDAGKSLHEDFHGMSGIDLNRAGTPLLEIVSEPDLRSPQEAIAYMKKIHALVRYLDISDGNMQEGSFRCDANVSIRPKGQETLGTRTEVKNLNSFRFVERALSFEIERQTEVLENRGEVLQETRLYDVDKGETRPMRSKEEANDYRYFPDPDLLPVDIDEAFVAQMRRDLPELPDTRKARFTTDYDLSAYDAGVLTASREMADYYENTVHAAGGEPKLCANWVMVDLAGALNKENLEIAQSPVSSEMLGRMVTRIADNTISGKIAKQVFESMWNGQGNADAIIEAKGLEQMTDAGVIETLVDEMIAANPKQVEQYRGGKDKLLGYFVGQVMKATRGKANPQQLNEILKRKLNG